MTTVAAEYDHMDIQQQYPDTVNNRWDEEWDNENSSARLFERSRIKALAGEAASRTGLHQDPEELLVTIFCVCGIRVLLHLPILG